MASLSEASTRDIHTKLLILCRHFPQLRVIWSQGPDHTCEIFKSLRSGYNNPDLQVLTASAHTASANFNPTDVLIKFPGVHRQNVHLLTNNFRNLIELS
eukprot:CAMPEP_0201559742 /NCGR_PEP_ID=MMETSP0173_2-20130828/76052_1 /ASSEMBLY_ACC=CAM_ASM_000268 /TAXON_ID=218659 /ORGANISM="Vexillifera sp., Strain DIVA3 564/2" /LENGTH=98 /DNA_ID=CAMNT_0047973979 /DNA_START=61 /DNA_END=354 /DNA_ORIENTATION=+